MSASAVNVSALYAALDVERAARHLSWRQLAATLQLSPSTFSRMANGHRPDADTFVALTTWLGQPAERFIRPAADEQQQPQQQPQLIAELAPLLRARRDLTEDDARHLQELFAAAVRTFEAERSSR